MNRSIQIVVVLAAAGLLAAGNYVALLLATAGPCAPCNTWFIGGPALLALLFLLTARRGNATETVVEPAAAPPTAKRDDAPALRLLATLQQEGRLVDFLQEDIGPYSDEQIGSAVRPLHEGCRKALRSCVTLEPVLASAEAEPVSVPVGFDPAAIRLTGNVSGEPPFQGILRHAGWRATAVTLPAAAGDDRVVAPAEVELA
jgi:uncharacterized protein DUF2760